MRDFLCPNCGQHLAFENSVCLSCGSALGFPLDDTALLMITSGEDSEHGGAVDSRQYQLCANLTRGSRCHWRTAAIAVLSPRRRPVARSVPVKPGSSLVNIRSLRVSGASSAVSRK
jgi:hypothetical protein